MSTVFWTLVSLSPPFSSSGSISSVTISSAPSPSGSSSCCSLSPPERNKPRSSLSGQTAIVSPGVFFGVWPVRFPTDTLDLLVGEQPRPLRTTVVMEEISEVRIVHDIEMTSIVQLHSLGGSPKQSVLTQNIELTRPGFCRRRKHGQ